MLPLLECGLQQHASQDTATTRELVLTSFSTHMEQHVAPILYTASRQAVSALLVAARDAHPERWSVQRQHASHLGAAHIMHMLQQGRQALEQPAGAHERQSCSVPMQPCSVLTALCTDATTGSAVVAAALETPHTAQAAPGENALYSPGPVAVGGGAAAAGASTDAAVHDVRSPSGSGRRASQQGAAVFDFAFDCCSSPDFHDAFRRLCDAHSAALAGAIGQFILQHKRAVTAAAEDGATHGPTAELGMPFLLLGGHKAAGDFWLEPSTASRSGGGMGQPELGAAQVMEWLLAQATAPEHA